MHRGVADFSKQALTRVGVDRQDVPAGSPMVVPGVSEGSAPYRHGGSWLVLAAGAGLPKAIAIPAAVRRQRGVPVRRCRVSRTAGGRAAGSSFGAAFVPTDG